jgi:hypothetical protein
MSKTPKPLSPGEELFAVHLVCHKIPFEREVCLVPSRKWRTDFLIECAGAQSLAVEIDGGAWTAGRHARGLGITADSQKMNAIVLAGYRPLRFTTQMVASGEAIDTILALL